MSLTLIGLVLFILSLVGAHYTEKLEHAHGHDPFSLFIVSYFRACSIAPLLTGGIALWCLWIGAERLGSIGVGVRLLAALCTFALTMVAIWTIVRIIGVLFEDWGWVIALQHERADVIGFCVLTLGTIGTFVPLIWKIVRVFGGALA